MRIRDKNKLAHEKAVADELMDALKIKPLGSRQGNPDKWEPDRIYRIDKKTIGVEVVTAYYTEEEAKATAEAAAEKPIAEDEIRESEIMCSPDASICDAIKECFEEKCKKAYSGADEIWLCINADATIAESAVIEKCVRSIKVPRHGFTRQFVTQRKSVNEGAGLIAIEFK